MNKFFSRTSSGVIFISILLILSFATLSSAQKRLRGPFPQIDTAINPHDLTDEYYAINGVIGKSIISRRNGIDFLSVFGWSSNPNHTNVRVLATLPGYMGNGGMAFWYPLGLLNEGGFTDDKAGLIARETAENCPIYIFPMKYSMMADLYGNNRQAALLAKTESIEANPLGLRMIVRVDYTATATDKGNYQMMEYMEKKNGLSLDGTPLIKSMEDIVMLAKYDCISMGVLVPGSAGLSRGRYAIAPVIFDPTNGVIARDAFLLMVGKEGQPLPDEQFFSQEFNCLQKAGGWCIK